MAAMKPNACWNILELSHMSDSAAFDLVVDRTDHARIYSVMDGSRLVIQTTNKLLAQIIQRDRYRDGYSIPNRILSAGHKELREILGLDPLE